MTPRWRSRDGIIPMAGVLTLAVIFLASQHVDWRIIHHAFLTGYALAFLVCTMLLLSWRKSLPAVPLGLMSTWLKLHVGAGLLLLPVFWLHIGKAWPNGLFEQILAGLFYGAVLSGIAGRLLQKILPVNLTTAGGEVTRERIPREIIRIRLEVERLVVDSAEEAGKRSLAMAYEQTLAWYFRKPRFMLAHVIGASAGRHWFNHHATRLALSLDPTERGYLDQIGVLAEQKHRLDHHYALQSLLRRWLFLHVPAAIAFSVFVIWHIALVHVYAQ
jgi:hypothetical protein